MWPCAAVLYNPTCECGSWDNSRRRHMVNAGTTSAIHIRDIAYANSSDCVVSRSNGRCSCIEPLDPSEEGKHSSPKSISSSPVLVHQSEWYITLSSPSLLRCVISARSSCVALPSKFPSYSPSFSPTTYLGLYPSFKLSGSTYRHDNANLNLPACSILYS
jgi:hypothetical protein